jgi:cytochrome d ubiquinol oxidase subunit I
VAVAASGLASGVLVLAANAWMQNPVGFTPGTAGAPAAIDPVAVLLNPAWPMMATHSALATYQAVGFAAAGGYALALLRGHRPERERYHRLGLGVAMMLAIVAAVLQPLTGDRLAKRTHQAQPEKLAAMEAHFETGRCAPLRLGGIPDEDRRELRYSLEIPCALSVLAGNSFDTEVAGLSAFPRNEWPNVMVTHTAFQIMVGAGTLMLLVALWYAWGRLRRRDWLEASPSRATLMALVACAPLGFIALEAGWVVTEAGRQPWVIYRVLRTADAVTPVADVGWSLAVFTALYLTLLVILLSFLRLLARGNDQPH